MHLFSIEQNTTPSKRATARQAAESPPPSTKKRKQSLMDDYVSSVSIHGIFFNNLVIDFHLVLGETFFEKILESEGNFKSKASTLEKKYQGRV